MGSITYNFLADSILFDEKAIQSKYSSLNDNQLEAVLQNYRSHCLKNLDEMVKDVKTKKSSLKVMSTIDQIPFDNIKQGALYFDQFIISDPLFALTSRVGKESETIGEYVGFVKSRIDRNKVAYCASLLKALTPMVAADFIKILPLTKPFEPSKHLRVDYLGRNYDEGMPTELLDFCRKQITVSSAKKDGDKWMILDENDFTPGIILDFMGCDGRFSKHFSYMEQEIFNVNYESRTFEAKMKLAEYPMKTDVWNNWVKQSVLKTSYAAIDRVLFENVMAADFGATYLTDNSFVSDMLVEQFGEQEDITSSSATQFMNINLPFLDRVDIGKLMDIRRFEDNTFTNFRIELERNFRDLRLNKDPYEIKLIQENIMHELAVVQVQKIEQKFRSLKKKGMYDAAILLGGLATTVQTAGWSLLASASAIVHGSKAISDFNNDIRENPSYLLWKVLKSK